MFETFPPPTREHIVAEFGKELDVHRSHLMVDRNLGLTGVYNLVHDPSVQGDEEISRLRQLHVDLDYAVRDAYGWSDLDLKHGFHEVRGQGIRFTFAPEVADEILDRLLELNKERYEAEVAAGLHKKGKAKTRRGDANQGSLLGEDA